MKICSVHQSISFQSIEIAKRNIDFSSYDYVITDKIENRLNKKNKLVYVGDIELAANQNIEFDFYFPQNIKESKILSVLEEDYKRSMSSFDNLNLSLLDRRLEERSESVSALKQEAMLNKEESLNVKGLGEYVIRLLGVNTIEQLVYETESLRILKYKGIKVSLIYIDIDDGFLCTRNTTRKIEGLGDIGDLDSVIGDPAKLANVLARPVLGHFKIHSQGLSSGDKLYALFESQEEFVENDYFLNMLKTLLFTNFVRVLQSERLLKNSSLLSQAFKQIQNTSLLISSDYTVRVSNRKESVNQKCYSYMFSRNQPCVGCPIFKNLNTDVANHNFGEEFFLEEESYVVHSSSVKSINKNFFLHIYETNENSKKRESIKIQRGKLQSLGLVTQALTHELNNPLTGIVELSRDMSVDYEGQTLEDLVEIESAAVRCINIIEDLKKFSSKKIEFERIDFSEVVRSALTLTKILTRNTSINVKFESEVWISGSETLLSQLVFNIVKNSVEAMDGKGSVDISLKKKEGSTVLRFQDTGPGLPDTMTDVTLFGTQNKNKGTGFGLFLVNEFVKLHKGELTFGTAKEGGAFFNITIPLNQ